MEKFKPLFCCPEYKVSNEGYVLSKKYNRPLKPCKNHGGYLLVNLTVNGKSKTVAVHRAVAIAFVPGYSIDKQVNHKDGNKENNRAENLEWVTPSENILHSVYVLGNNYGKENSSSKKIIGIDKNGNVKYKYDCIAECARAICETNKWRCVQSSICRALKGLRKTYKGCTWKYIE